MIIIGADFHPEFQQIALSFTTWVGKLKEVWALACPGFTSAHRALYGKLACRAFTRCWPTPEEHSIRFI